MFNIFGKSESDAGSARTGADVVATPITNPIADVEIVGEVVIATLTVTELSDEPGASQLAGLLDDLDHSGARHFVLDISNVQFMNSACLGCLVEALNRMAKKGGRIALVNPAGSVQSLFRITRLDSVFLIMKDVPTALNAVEKAGSGDAED
jgi:anti-anti-sigma factor